MVVSAGMTTVDLVINGQILGIFVYFEILIVLPFKYNE